MKPVLYTPFILLFSLFIDNLGYAKQEGALEQGMVNPGHHEQPAWFKTSFLDINEDIQDAKAAGKRLMLFFYQDGCPYCKKLLEDNFGQRDITEKTRQHFDVVTINIWGDREVTIGDDTVTEKQFAEKLRIMYTPTLLFFNEQGKAVLRANGYYPPAKFNAALDYVLEHKDQKMSFHDYLAKAMPAPASGQLHREVETLHAPYDFFTPAGKDYRLVLFEQKQCKACDELHNDIFKRPASQQQLKRFDVAVLDMWSDDTILRPDGKATSMKDWARDLSIQYAPSLVFLDKTGKEVFRIEAYLKAFHIQSVMDYVASGAWKTQPNFQRYIDKRADHLREQGVTIDLMK